MTDRIKKYVSVRDRGLALPSLQEVESSEISIGSERQFLVAHIKMKNLLYAEWLKFAQKNYSGMPTAEETGQDDWMEFTAAYSVFLSRFKNARKSTDRALRYAASIRAQAYDEVFAVWTDISQMYRQGPVSGFSLDEFGLLALRVGRICHQLDMLARDQLNAAEHLIALEQNSSSRNSRIGGRLKGNAARRDLYGRAQRFVEQAWERDGADYEWKRRPKAIVQSYVKLIAQEFTTRDGAPLMVAEDTVRGWMSSPTNQ